MPNTKFLKRHGIHTAFDLKNAPDHWIKKYMTIVGLRTVWELRKFPVSNLKKYQSPTNKL